MVAADPGAAGVGRRPVDAEVAHELERVSPPRVLTGVVDDTAPDRRGYRPRARAVANMTPASSTLPTRTAPSSKTIGLRLSQARITTP